MEKEEAIKAKGERILTVKNLTQHQRNLIHAKSDGTICECGSKEFFLAPIVHARCNNCKKPLPNI